MNSLRSHRHVVNGSKMMNTFNNLEGYIRGCRAANHLATELVSVYVYTSPHGLFVFYEYIPGATVTFVLRMCVEEPVL